jgi:arylsulfatase A
MLRTPNIRVVEIRHFAAAIVLLLASCTGAPGKRAGGESAAASPAAHPTAIRPAEPETILLHSREAIVHGKTLRYEPQPQKNTLGYWTDAADWASWDFTVNRPGKYAVEILQGCGTGSGGSEVEFRSAGQVLPVTVQDTGGFQNFVPRVIGQFTFDRAGVYTLEVRPVKKPGLAVMDLRQVTLREVTESGAGGGAR